MSPQPPLLVGVPTEIKPDEGRVAITPDGVRELFGHGVAVLVQSGAGTGATTSTPPSAPRSSPPRMRCGSAPVSSAR
jgi:hypothetical protein